MATSPSATRSVRFDFINTKTPNQILLTTYHDLPITVIDSSDEGIKWSARFASIIKPLINSHKDLLLPKLSKTCVYCNKLATNYLGLPKPVNHGGDGIERSLLITVVPHCGDSVCTTNYAQKELGKALGSIQATREHVERLTGISSTWDPRYQCQVCKKSEGLMLCAECKMMAYCGKEHQKMDWKVHKKICKTWKGAHDRKTSYDGKGACSTQ